MLSPIHRFPDCAASLNALTIPVEAPGAATSGVAFWRGQGRRDLFNICR